MVWYLWHELEVIDNTWSQRPMYSHMEFLLTYKPPIPCVDLLNHTLSKSTCESFYFFAFIIVARISKIPSHTWLALSYLDQPWRAHFSKSLRRILSSDSKPNLRTTILETIIDHQLLLYGNKVIHLEDTKQYICSSKSESKWWPQWERTHDNAWSGGTDRRPHQSQLIFCDQVGRVT